MFTVKNPGYEARIRRLWDAPFIRHLGAELVRLSPGVLETAITPRPEHLQQDGFVHAGVIATLADHSAGGAAGTLIADREIVLTSEFKIHLLRPGRGRLTCVATVLKPGRLFSICEAEVRADGGALVAKLLGTLAIVSPTPGS